MCILTLVEEPDPGRIASQDVDRSDKAFRHLNHIARM